MTIYLRNRLQELEIFSEQSSQSDYSPNSTIQLVINTHDENAVTQSAAHSSQDQRQKIVLQVAVEANDYEQ